jgi:GcrA cell cycle regulator
MSWTDERVEMLKKLWLEGLSASQIAAQLGGVTRNAVIGKVHRLGMSGRVKANTSSSRSAPRKKTSSARSAATGSSSGGMSSTGAPRRMSSGPVLGNVALKTDEAPEQKMNHQAAEDVVIPMSREITLLQLSEATCKWPAGDPTSDDFSFCGHPVRDGAPYCEHHSKVAYQPSNGRRKT